jgi:O-antigen ligase
LGAKKFLEWPFGYGIGQGAATLDYVNEGGLVTIDTYYLLVLLEYGLLGFIVYYGMFVVGIYEAGKRGMRSHPKQSDRAFLIPIALSLFIFLIIKSVFAQQDNHPLVFMMLGAIMAISGQHRSAATLE